jgi:hypothetical protein
MGAHGGRPRSRRMAPDRDMVSAISLDRRFAVAAQHEGVNLRAERHRRVHRRGSDSVEVTRAVGSTETKRARRGRGWRGGDQGRLERTFGWPVPLQDPLDQTLDLSPPVLPKWRKQCPLVSRG